MLNLRFTCRTNLFNTIRYERARYYFKTIAVIFACAFITLKVNASNDKSRQGLTLVAAVEQALNKDPWLVSNQHRQNAIESLSIAAGTLPDPRVNLDLANIAADSFDFNQETMTQFKVAISQVFPRGDSLAYKQKKLEVLGRQFPIERKNRQAKVAVTVSKLWLDVYKAQQSIYLIEKDRALFEQLADVAQASYSSTIGKTRQQDIVRAQLELTRLDDRLTQLRQKKEMALQQLSEWLYDARGEENQLYGSGFNNAPEIKFVPELSIDLELPSINMINQPLYTSRFTINQQTLYQLFSSHPAVLIFDKKIEASKLGIELAKQKYKPEWGVNASYGYRDDSPLGLSRSDLFSIGVSFDIPIFTNNRQDKQVQSEISKTAAIKTNRWQMIREMIAMFATQRAQLSRLSERQILYQQRLLPQMHNQAEASLIAYTNDDGDFSEVVRSRIAELNATIDALDIDVEKQKRIIQLNYFLMKDVREITANNEHSINRSGEK